MDTKRTLGGKSSLDFDNWFVYKTSKKVIIILIAFCVVTLEILFFLKDKFFFINFIVLFGKIWLLFISFFFNFSIMKFLLNLMFFLAFFFDVIWSFCGNSLGDTVFLFFEIFSASAILQSLHYFLPAMLLVVQSSLLQVSRINWWQAWHIVQHVPRVLVIMQRVGRIRGFSSSVSAPKLVLRRCSPRLAVKARLVCCFNNHLLN